MAEICVIEDKESYYLITDFDSEATDYKSIFTKIEDALKAKAQDFVMSLASVKVLYSSHLAAFVRINQTLRKNNLSFILADISPEIKNLLQITQLDSIFPVYETLEAFQSSRSADKSAQQKLGFEWQIVKENSAVNVTCKGCMVAGESLDELQKSILSYSNVSFDFSKLKSMDAASLSFLETTVNNHSVQITGASKELAGQIRQKPISEKISFQ